MQVGTMEAIFPFNDQKALQVQDDSVCNTLFEDFWTKVLNCDSRLYQHEIDLQKVRKPLVKLHWRARYASVVMVCQINPILSSIVVLGLDRWEYKVHSSIHGRERTATPDVCAPATFEMGSYAANKIEELLQTLDEELTKSEESNRGNQRAQSGNHQGNQKTPSFVAAKLEQAIESKNTAEIQGGTTDVGLHTGCVPRNTSFPLVLTTFRTMLRRQGGCDDDQIFFKCVTVYFLSHLFNCSSQLNSFVPREIDRNVCIIREIESYLHKIENKTFIATIVKELKVIHQKLMDLRPGADIPSPGTLFHDSDTIPNICKTLRSPRFPDIKAPCCLSDHASKIAQARADAEVNLQWSDLESESYTGKIQDSWVQISKLNRFFWGIAETLQDNQEQCDINDLRKKLDIFSRHIQLAHTVSLESTPLMSVVLRSYELLASWICYCCAHRAVEQMHYFFRKYGSALDPNDLVHLVLDHNRAREALSYVRAFLRMRLHKLRPFSSDETATLALALEYGRDSAHLNSIHEHELRVANCIIDERRKRIQSVQAQLRSLDYELANANAKLALAKSEKEISENRDYTVSRRGKRIYNEIYYQAVNKLYSCQAEVDALWSRIKSLETKPENVVLGLPENKDLSLAWLFFLYMPDEFRNLAALSHFGQTKLWKTAPAPATFPQNLQRWFVSYRKHPWDNPCVSAMQLASKSPAMAFHVVPATIRSYQRRTGVFTPCSYFLNPSWKESDPFAQGRTYEHTAALFTELLPKTDQHQFMQQFLCLVPSATRENMGIARRDSKPNWLLYEQFAMFARMRSGGCTQIRHLVTALQDSLLPFSHECTLILLKQLIFHVGPEEWWGDLTPSMFGYDRIAKQLAHRVELLRESPKSCGELLLFGVVSSYFGQVDVECHKCAREFSSIARAWATSVGSEVEEVENVPAGLYWKQGKFFGYALLCRTFDSLQDDELFEMVEMLVLYRQKVLFATQDPQSKSLEQPIAQAMSSKLEDILKVVHKDLHRLTKVISLVLDNVPFDLAWYPVSFQAAENTACFEAAADQLYSINVLNGTILVDGVPPGFLPASIVDDPQYRRIFGKRNFEVVVLGSWHFRSARLVEGRLTFEFIVDSSKTLHIVEYDKGILGCPPQELQLIVRDNLDLPDILREEYSHWYSKADNVIILRKPTYRDRHIHYLLTSAATYRLPDDSQETSVTKALSRLNLCRRLLLGETKLSRILQDFELSKFVQIETDAEQKAICYLLPRYGLSFVQSEHNVLLEQFQGFYLQSLQVLHDTIPGLRRCLSMMHSDGREKIIIADGAVESNAQIVIPNDRRCKVSYHMYALHKRFRHLVPVNTIGRLHLAALYASSSCLIADRRVGKPGVSVAVDLVRQSWKNEPLDTPERLKLMEVSTFSWLSCTLRLMCTWVWRSSHCVHFLYNVDDLPTNAKLAPDRLAQDEYRQSPFCQSLLPCEEQDLLGSRQPKRFCLNLPLRTESANISFVRNMECRIRDKYVVESTCHRSDKFPLSRPLHCIGLERELYESTEESYRTYSKIPSKSIGMIEEVEIRTIHKEGRQRRKNVESMIFHALNEQNSNPLHQVRFVSGRIDRANAFDVLQMVFDASKISSFNPALGEKNIATLHLNIIDWAVLCVFEDKMTRIIDAKTNYDDAALIQEICCFRNWDPASHLRWLAFEVEQQLQIRPNQYEVVHQLQSNPCSLMQLVMGAGKKTARINILPSIFREAVDYYRDTLVASVQQVKIFCLPFDRSVSLDEHRALHIATELDSCYEHNGVLAMTPQHRNSLLLKQHDHDISIEYDQKSYIDIFDESDAILSHDFQLVYALGKQQPLPSGVSRWKVLHGLLQILARDKSEEMLSVTNDSNLVHKESDKLGAFPCMRFLLQFHGKERHFGSLWCKALMMNPPHDLQWMKDVQPNEHKTLIKLMSDPFMTNVLESIRSNTLFREKASDILACRGFIAFGILFHGLESRYRVNYGLNTASNTVMAVPFSACDTPKLRAQYSHPDMELVFTALSYLNEGLTETQMKDALMVLQTMGPVAQRLIYKEWIDAVRSDVVPEKLLLFDEIMKVDVENNPLVKTIHKHLGKCMEAISFWVTNFVYNTGTYRFPQRRTTSAWNLVSAPCSWGFSGTDDNKFLLPLSVKQLVPAEENLRATNGSMIQTIIDRVENITLLTGSPDEENLTWKVVLNQCISMNVNALIDVAGLMAGCINLYAAEYLSEKGKFKGVIYFDEEWKVFENKNKRPLPLTSSSLSEADCFVYFDESRCRGSDMKLKTNARALVTLEPRLTKDKFLQGCMRMRKLRQNGQSLILAGSAEMISPKSTTKLLLEKIFHNTVTTTKKGIPIYFKHGLNFFSFPSPIEDDVSLESMYGRHIPCYTDFGDFLEATFESSEASCMEARDLVEHCKRIGKGTVTAMRGDFNEECEQELEEEAEEEEQEEIEMQIEVPYSQIDWNFQEAFSKPDHIFANYFVSLGIMLKRQVPCLSAFPWSEKIFCSPNFWNTIRGEGRDLSLYLRPVDTVLVLPDGRIAFLSAYELEKLLPIWWETEKPKATLRHLSLSELHCGFGRELHVFQDEVLAMAKLFRGYVQFTEEERKYLTPKLIKLDEPELFVRQLLHLRSRQAFFERSDLHKILVRLHMTQKNGLSV